MSKANYPTPPSVTSTFRSIVRPLSATGSLGGCRLIVGLKEHRELPDLLIELAISSVERICRA